MNREQCLFFLHRLQEKKPTPDHEAMAERATSYDERRRILAEAEAVEEAPEQKALRIAIRLVSEVPSDNPVFTPKEEKNGIEE